MFCNFLYSFVGYSVLNTAGSSLSSFIDIDGVPVGKHLTITRFLRGVFNIRSTLPRYNYTWDAGTLVTI